MNTQRFEIEVEEGTDVSTLPNVVSFTKMENTETEYWQALHQIADKIVEEFQEQDMLTWEDYCNTVVDSIVKDHFWVKFGRARLTLLSATNNYYAWLDYEVTLDEFHPTKTMATCAMTRDLLDFCELANPEGEWE